MKKIIFLATFLIALTVFSASTSATKVLFVANCNQSITLRESPSINSNEITQIPLGQGVAIIDGYSASYPNEGPDFYLVRVPNGTYGYIVSDKVD